MSARPGIVQTAAKIARGELDPAKLPKSVAKRAADVTKALGGVFGASPRTRQVVGARERVIRARSA